MPDDPYCAFLFPGNGRNEARGLIPIKTILQRTGLARQTVHFYLRKGVLPKPVQKGPTSALYPPSTIELLGLARLLQEEKRLSLDEIAGLFRQHRYDPRGIARAVGITTPAASSKPAPRLTVEEVLSRLLPPPPKNWFGELTKSGALPLEVKHGSRYLSADAAEAVRAAWEAVQLGAPTEQLRHFAALAVEYAAQEFRQFVACVHALPLTQDSGARVAPLFTLLQAFTSHCQKHAMQALLLHRARMSNHLFLGPNVTYVFPSKTFLEKNGLFREMDRLSHRLERNPNDLAALAQMARASALSSDWSRLHTAAERILALREDDPAALAWFGQSLNYMGRMEESIAFLKVAASRKGGPMVKVRLAQALIGQAFRSNDAGLLMNAEVSLFQLAAEAVRESAGNPALHRKVRLNLALDHLGFSNPLGLSRPVEHDVAALYDELHSSKSARLPLLSKISLAQARMYVTFALYIVRKEQKRGDADQLLAEIAAIDPDCVLSKKARRRPVLTGLR